MGQARTNTRALLERAILLHQKGDLSAAKALYQEVLALNPEEPNAWHLLGVIAWHNNDLALAEENIRTAIKFHDAAPSYYNNLAGVLRKSGDFQGSIEAYEKALQLSPQDEVARKELSVTFHHQGIAFSNQKQWNEAIKAYYRVLDLFPDSVATFNNLATILQHRNRREEARELYDRALRVDPHNLLLRYNRAICYLTEAKLTEGWLDFEASKEAWYPLQDNRTNLPWVHLPLWDGKSNLKDKSILIWGDQGIGDEIIYSSLIPELLERCARVTIECTDRLVPLFERSFPEAKVLGRLSSPLPGADFDCHAPGLWLARCLRPTLESFLPRGPFLKKDVIKTAHFRKRYEGFQKKRIVGLSWYTQSQAWGLQRSIPLPDILSQLPLDDTLIIDLQYGNTADAWQKASEMYPNLTALHDDEVDQFVNMDDYAAQIAACDTVITICNTTSHVAGALGVPTSVFMNDQGLTWYWFTKGETCPWYPCLKLLRLEEKDRMKKAAAMVDAAVSN